MSLYAFTVGASTAALSTLKKPRTDSGASDSKEAELSPREVSGHGSISPSIEMERARMRITVNNSTACEQLSREKGRLLDTKPMMRFVGDFMFFSSKRNAGGNLEDVKNANFQNAKAELEVMVTSFSNELCDIIKATLKEPEGHINLDMSYRSKLHESLRVEVDRVLADNKVPLKVSCWGHERTRFACDGSGLVLKSTGEMVDMMKYLKGQIRIRDREASSARFRSLSVAPTET